MSSTRPIHRIIDILTPSLGPFMAKAAVEGHVKKLGLRLDSMTRAELEALAEQIGLGMSVFVGPQKSAEIAAKIARLPIEGP